MTLLSALLVVICAGPLQPEQFVLKEVKSYEIKEDSTLVLKREQDVVVYNVPEGTACLLIDESRYNKRNNTLDD